MKSSGPEVLWRVTWQSQSQYYSDIRYVLDRIDKCKQLGIPIQVEETSCDWNIVNF